MKKLLFVGAAISLVVVGFATTTHQSVKLPVNNTSAIVTSDNKEQPVITSNEPTSPVKPNSTIAQPLGQAPDSIPAAADVAPATSPTTVQPAQPSDTPESTTTLLDTTVRPVYDSYGQQVGSIQLAP